MRYTLHAVTLNQCQCAVYAALFSAKSIRRLTSALHVCRKARGEDVCGKVEDAPGYAAAAAAVALDPMQAQTSQPSPFPEREQGTSSGQGGATDETKDVEAECVGAVCGMRL